ncbi:MAG: hypothetical protein VX738_12575 [Planctomycetota bacterium]|nr:hypothetical protein [Planctomycetota bacterium]
MQTEQVIKLLESPQDAKVWLASLGIIDTDIALQSLLSLNETGMTLDLVSVTLTQLEEILPGLAKPDRALAALEQFIVVSRNAISLGALWERDAAALPTLMTMFSASKHLGELLIAEPECYDLLRMTDGQPVDREILADEIVNEVCSVSGETETRNQLERICKRELLRIAYGDLGRQQDTEIVLQQTSFLYEGLLRAAFEVALSMTAKRVEQPPETLRQNVALIALGDLAGEQMSFGTTMKVIVLTRSSANHTPESQVTLYSRLVAKIVKLLLPLSEASLLKLDFGFQLSAQPSTRVTHIRDAIRFLDFSGRTWQRQALICARPCIGNLTLGAEFLQHVEPWIYRRYLNRADLTGLRSLKRRLYRSETQDAESLDVLMSMGGIQETKAVVQFIQLLNGSNFPEIRVTGTLPAIATLYEAGLLTLEESNTLRGSFLVMKQVQNRLQIMIASGVSRLPEDESMLQQIAEGLGYQEPEQSLRLTNDIRHSLNVSRKILDRLLDEAVLDETAETPPEVDIVLDPHPTNQYLEEVLGKHNFRNVELAHQYLTDLATERIPFLSTRRCRHFLASIAPQLLEAIARTPDPDATLANLCGVSESLGGKGILWELFQFNPPTLKLYVQLCSTSPYLIGILTSYPGMIDELLDSLLLDHLPTQQSLQSLIDELSKSASLGGSPLVDVIQTFKHAQHLRVGVRDILGKDSLTDAHRSLSDIMDICLQKIADDHYHTLVKKHGRPVIQEGPRKNQTAAMMMLGIGKLGGREPNFHSDAEVLFFYDAPGNTEPVDRDRHVKTTSNHHFFNELAKRILQSVTRSGSHGRLFEMNSKLRATRTTAPLAISVGEFLTFLNHQDATTEHFMQLCKARVIYTSDKNDFPLIDHIHEAIISMPRPAGLRDEIYTSRIESEQGAGQRNLKRYQGGTMDVEYIVQMLQLMHAKQHPDILQTGTLAALERLQQAQCLNPEDATALSKSYIFLREIEAGLRLMDTSARHDLPEQELELIKLASLLGYDSPQTLVTVCSRFRQDNRKRFLAIFGRTLTD